MVQLGRNDEAKAIYAAFISRHSGEVRVVAVGGEFTECQSPLDARVPDGKKRTNNPASLMHRRPFDFNCVIPSGRDAVHICSRNGNLEMLQWMYAKRQDILLRDQGGNESESAKHAVPPQLHESAPNFELVGGGGDTAVHLAAWNGHVSVLQFLCNVVGLDAFQRIGMARSRRDKESDQGRLRRIIQRAVAHASRLDQLPMVEDQSKRTPASAARLSGKRHQRSASRRTGRDGEWGIQDEI